MREQFQKNEIYLDEFFYSHMDILNKWYSDSRMQKAIGTSPLRENQKKKHFKYKFQNPEKYSKGIFLKVTNELIGYVSLKNWNKEEKVARIEIIIDPDRWGKGYGCQAAQLIFNEAKKLNLKRILSDCSNANLRSIAFHKKLGFKKIREKDEMIFFEIEGF